MSFLQLTQEVTYWTIASVDGNSDITWAAGIKAPARWARVDGVTTTSNGQEQRTSFAVYTDLTIPKRSMIFLGDLGGQLEPPSEAREVLTQSDSPSMTELNRALI